MSVVTKETDSLSIRELTLADIDCVVDIHLNALPHDFLPSLGRKLLTSYYVNCLECIEKNRIYILGSFYGDVLVGFCQIAFEPISFLRIVKVSTLLHFLRVAISRPVIFVNGLIQFLQPTLINNETAEIAFIAVMPQYQRKGIGSLLVEVAMHECQKRRKMFITTKTANIHLSDCYLKRFKAKKIKRLRVIRGGFDVLMWPTRSPLEKGQEFTQL